MKKYISKSIAAILLSSASLMAADFDVKVGMNTYESVGNITSSDTNGYELGVSYYQDMMQTGGVIIGFGVEGSYHMVDGGVSMLDGMAGVSFKHKNFKNFSVKLKYGYAHLTTDSSGSNPKGFGYGVEGNYMLNKNWGVFASYRKYSLDYANSVSNFDFDITSVGVNYRF